MLKKKKKKAEVIINHEHFRQQRLTHFCEIIMEREKWEREAIITTFKRWELSFGVPWLLLEPNFSREYPSLQSHVTLKPVRLLCAQPFYTTLYTPGSAGKWPVLGKKEGFSCPAVTQDELQYMRRVQTLLCGQVFGWSQTSCSFVSFTEGLARSFSS